jgi:hypothetical protein
MVVLLLVGASIGVLAGVVSSGTSAGEPPLADEIRQFQIAKQQPEQKNVYERLHQPKPEPTPRRNLTVVEIRGDGSDVVQKAMHEGRLQIAQFQGRIRLVWDGDKNQLSELEAVARALREGRLQVNQPDTYLLSTQ